MTVSRHTVKRRRDRAGKGDCPENSLIAFVRSAGTGLPVELDARLLADGKPAVFRDANTFRMTGFALPICGLRTGERRGSVFSAANTPSPFSTRSSKP